MPLAVLGSGIVGRVLGAEFLKHGDQVMIGTHDLEKAEASPPHEPSNLSARCGAFLAT
jgi:predicted dinucleotide-binding enzyme